MIAFVYSGGGGGRGTFFCMEGLGVLVLLWRGGRCVFLFFGGGMPNWPGSGARGLGWCSAGCGMMPSPPPPTGRVLGSANRQRDNQRPRNGRVVAGGLGRHGRQVCGGPRVVPGGLHGQVGAPLVHNPHACHQAYGGASAQAPTSHVPLLHGAEWVGYAAPLDGAGAGPGLVLLVAQTIRVIAVVVC